MHQRPWTLALASLLAVPALLVPAATALAGPTVTATQLEVTTTEPVTNIPAGTTIDYTVTAADASGTTATTYASTVTFTSSDSKSLVSGDGTPGVSNTHLFTATDAGSYVFHVTFDGATSAGGSWHVNAAGNEAPALTGSSTAAVTVASGPVASLSLSPSIYSGAAGQTVPFTAEGRDQYGNDAGNQTASTTFGVDGGSCVQPSTGTTPGAATGPGNTSCAATVAGAHTVTGTVPTAGGGTATGTSRLSVTAGSLASLTLSPATAVASSGGSVTYQAQGFDAYGNSKGDVTAGTQFSISGHGTCIQSACSAASAGSYTITGNDNGSTGTATLTAYDPPGAPTITAVKAGDTQLEIDFTPPASDGGTPILYYSVTLSGGGASGTANVLKSPVTISQLTDGTAYSVTVTAHTAAGAGAPSAVASGTPVVIIAPVSISLGSSATFVTVGTPVIFGGQVTRNGSPVPGVKVLLLETFTDKHVAPLGTVVTNSDGLFRMTVKAIYNGTVTAVAEGSVSYGVPSRVLITFRLGQVHVKGRKVTVSVQSRPGFIVKTGVAEKAQLLLVNAKGHTIKVLQTVRAQQRKIYKGEANGTNLIAFKPVTLKAGVQRLVVKIVQSPVNIGVSTQPIVLHLK